MQENIYRIGSWRVTRISEITLEFAPTALIPAWDDGVLGAEAETVVRPTRAAHGNRLSVPVQSWLVQDGTCRILIDTGVGNGRQRAFPAFANLTTGYLERLVAAGAVPEEVDYVFCTHLHTDHVGWNTREDGGRWLPTFPRARYVWGRVEGATARQAQFEEGPAAGVFGDSIRPVITAGLVDEIDPGPFGPIDGVIFHATPGHSPGHLSISIRSGGEEAFFGGDVLHNQVQVLRPEWNSVFCETAELARTSRLWALGYAADRNALFFGSHLGGSSVGRVCRAGERFTWIHE